MAVKSQACVFNRPSIGDDQEIGMAAARSTNLRELGDGKGRADKLAILTI
jgi:hypothetical protein